MLQSLTKLNNINDPVLFGIKRMDWNELNLLKLNWTEIDWTGSKFSYNNEVKLGTEMDWTKMDLLEMNWTENKLGRTGPKFITTPTLIRTLHIKVNLRVRSIKDNGRSSVENTATPLNSWIKWAFLNKVGFE